MAIQPSEGDRDRAFAETQTILKVYPNVKVIMAIAAPAVPGAAEAVKQSGRTDVKVTGLSLPNMNKPYVKAGVVESVVLWNTVDLGYLTVYAANALGNGTLKRGDREINAGRLGKFKLWMTRCVWVRLLSSTKRISIDLIFRLELSMSLDHRLWKSLGNLIALADLHSK